MSRIGKKEIAVPKNVHVSFSAHRVFIQGPYGALEQQLHPEILFNVDGNKIILAVSETSKKAGAFHGLYRALVQNMIIGVSQKFEKILLIEGVGYKCQLNKNRLILSMGFSHNVELLVPSEITVKIETPTKLLIEGIDKQKVGLFASKIRSVRAPEPYKGKGIRYADEKIRRKVGKTGK